jgi:hypothetical protein
LDEFHHDEIDAVGGLDFVNGDDVGVIQRRSGLRFLDKASPTVLIFEAIGGQNLDRHVAVEA